jgi:hypothetical protein
VVRARYDQFAKRLLDKALSMVGEVRTQLEIHGEVQAADVWFLPRAGHEAERVRLGLLGRMAETACLLEPFHFTPGGDEVLDCLNKQLTLRRNLVREARKDARRPPDIPRLWILSAGRPETVLAGLGCSPLADWPTGVWQAPSLLATSLVVLRDLPETRDTLPLRLMGNGASLKRAMVELDALPAADWEPRAFVPLLLAFRLHVPQDRRDPENNDEDDMGYAEEMEALYAKWERRIEERGEKKGMRKGMRLGVKKGMEKGKEEGKEEGLRTALVNVYQARFGALPAALRTVIEATKDAPTLQDWTTLVGTATADEIAAALLPNGRLRGESRRANETGKARRDPGQAPARKRTSRSARPSE